MAIFVNDTKVKTFRYPGGECYVRVDPSVVGKEVIVFAKLHNSDEILQLLLAVNAIRQINAKVEIELVIPYFPYARQDKVYREGEPLSFKMMTELINNLNCDSITIYDPHSEAVRDSLNNCKTIELLEIISNNFLIDKIIDEKLTVISPDEGARKKIEKVADNAGIETMFASKKRDLETGNVVYVSMEGDIKGKNCIILDDICDGANTFVELGKLLKSRGANKVYLYVTHGIFSKGLEILKRYFTHVYCCHTMLEEKDIDNSFLTIFKKGSQC